MIKNTHGFTLLEIIIAIGILAAMTMTMTDITTGIMFSKKRAEQRNETRHGVAIALSKISDDLKMAFQADKKFDGKDKSYKTGFVADTNKMNFSTMSNVHFVKNNRDTDQIHVGYFLVKNNEGNTDLVRRNTNHLTDDLEEGGQGFVLINDVKDFDLEYFDGNKKEWQDKWDTESISSAGKLPQIVKVKITVYGEPLLDDEDRRKEYFYELHVPIEMYNKKVSF